MLRCAVDSVSACSDEARLDLGTIASDGIIISSQSPACSVARIETLKNEGDDDAAEEEEEGGGQDDRCLRLQGWVRRGQRLITWSTSSASRPDSRLAVSRRCSSSRRVFGPARIHAVARIADQIVALVVCILLPRVQFLLVFSSVALAASNSLWPAFETSLFGSDLFAELIDWACSSLARG